MKATQLLSLLASTIPAGLPVLVTGAPGIGKSDIVAQAAADSGADMILSHPAVADPTDARGLPWPKTDGKTASEATFLPYGELARALKAKKRTVWFLDDLGQAPPAVQASFMQLLLARRVNGHALPDTVTFVAATNRRTDRAGVAGILEPVKSRFGCIVELSADIDEWCTWAFAHDLPPVLIAFLRFRPDLLCAFQPSQDLTNSPVPRTWARLAQLEALGLPNGVEAEAFAGAVGVGAATEYLAFRKMAELLPSIDGILTAPDTAPIPSKPGELYAVSVGLSARGTDKNLGRIGVYCQRLLDASRGEFAALTIRDIVRRLPNITNCAAFVRLASGPVGQLISGTSAN